MGAVTLIAVSVFDNSHIEKENERLILQVKRLQAATYYHRVGNDLKESIVDSLVMVNQRLTQYHQKLGTIMPVKSTYFITGRFGDSRGDHIHQGTDLAIPTGTPLFSPISGRVLSLWDERGGNYAYIYNEFTAHVFMHLQYPPIEGDIVAGDLVAFSGNSGRSSGPHLHWEIFVGDARIDPEDYINILL